MTEAEIKDFQRDEVVGQLVDDELEILDETFEQNLFDFVIEEDRAIETIIPGEEPRSYQNYRIEEGEPGYALMLTDELQAPYDVADLSIRSELTEPQYPEETLSNSKGSKGILRRSLQASLPDDASDITADDETGETAGDSELRSTEEKADYLYPDAPADDAADGVKEAVKEWREEVPMEEKKDTALLYWLLGSGTPEYKMSKQDAEYKHQPEEGMMCANCDYYYVGVDGDGVCSKVRGEVQGGHWCRLWGVEDDGLMAEKANHNKIDSHLFEAYKSQVWVDDLTKAPQMWAGDGNVPSYVQDWVKQTIDNFDPFWDGDYSDLPPASNIRVKEIVTDAITSGNWSSGQISSQLEQEFEGITEEQANTIARTEVSAVLNKAREVSFKARGDEPKFDWVGPDDAQTTIICQEIKAAVPDSGLPLDELRDVVKEVAENWPQRGGTPDRVAQWVPHFNCRHTFDTVNSAKSLSKRRVYVDSPEDAPEDVSVQQGSQGGTFYEVEGDEADSDSEDVSQVPEGSILEDDERRVSFNEVDLEVGEPLLFDTGNGEVRLEVSDVEGDATSVYGPAAGYIQLEDGTYATLTGEQNEDLDGNKYPPDAPEDKIRALTDADGVAEAYPEPTGSKNPEDWNVDWDDTNNGRHSPDERSLQELNERQQEIFRNEWEEASNEEGVQEILENIGLMKGASTTPGGAYIDKVYKEAFGLEGDVRDVSGDVDEVNEGDIEALEVYREASKEFIEQNYGPEFTLHRGLGTHVIEDLRPRLLSQYKEGETEEVAMRDNPVSIWTKDEQMANNYDKGIVARKDFSTDDVLGTPDAVLNLSRSNKREGEVNVNGWSMNISTDDLYLGKSDKTFSEVIENPVEAHQSSESRYNILKDFAAFIQNQGDAEAAQKLRDEIVTHQSYEENKDEYDEAIELLDGIDNQKSKQEDSDIIDIRDNSKWLYELREAHTNDKTEKRRIYIDSPDEAPEDVTVEEGDEGGLYYETEDSVSFDSVDFDDVDTRPGFPALESGQRQEAYETLMEETGVEEETVYDVVELMFEWKDSRDSDGAIELAELFIDPPNNELGDFVNGLGELSQAFLREKFGDSITLYRGVSDSEYAEIEDEIDRSGESNPDMKQLENFSTLEEQAEEFGKTITTELPIEDVVFSTDFAARPSFTNEAEITVDTENIVLSEEDI